ncbi:MAG: VIT1/CCC1 transporter family protein [Thaumarchaeota archaeon]|nr:VIT1/CCC1 transporter family protein [Nitrososphaerota archaeon]
MEEEREVGAGVPSLALTGENNPQQAQKPFTHEAYVERHAHIGGRGLISASALGLADGLVTNLAFLTGFSGAVASIDLIRFAGVAAMLAGSVSMFFGGILSARSDQDLFKADSNREAYEIENERDEETWELKRIYVEKGLTEEEAEMVVARLADNKEKFLEDMLANEVHIHRDSLQNPYVLGAVIGLSFLVGAVVPLVPFYVFPAKPYSVVASVAASLVFLFAAGEWKGRIVKRRPWRSGLETLLIGASAAGILYVIGSFFVFV